MKFNKYLFFISIIFIKIYISKCTLIFPIETLSEDNYIIENKTSHQGIIRNLLYKDIYTIFEIGSPIQKIPLFIKTRGIEFEITSLTIKKDNLLEYHLKYNLSSIFNKYNFYNENKSLTFQTEGCINNHNMFSDHLLDCLSNDNVFFYEDKNFEKKIKFENFDFNLVKNKEENITGVLGIGLFDKSGDIEKSFIKLLKNKKIINNYNWYFNFDSWNDTNGKLIIGSLPHEDYPDIYSEQDLLYTYIPYDFSTISKVFKIEFDDIYTNPINSTFYIKLYAKNAILFFDSNIIIGPKEFETTIKDIFLNNFILNKKCFEDIFKQSIDYYNQLKFYYCDINIKDILYEILPSITFISKDLNFTFEITKDELYKIEGNYIYFLVLFDSGRQNNWYLGKQVSLKYPFVFNVDSNKIGLYQKYKKSGINNNSNSDIKRINYNKIIMIFIVIILSIGLVIIGIIIGKLLYGIHRKKRANELIDNYEYIHDENLNKDINNNIKYNNKNMKGDLNNKNSNNFSIEMKINV